MSIQAVPDAISQDEAKQLVIQYAGYCNIDPGVAVAQAQEESNFHSGIQSGTAANPIARGLMQFTKDTWAQYGVGDWSNAFDPYHNLDAWCAYMTDLLTMFNGDYVKALTAYNGGPGHFTDPQTYGPPTAAAQKYGQTIAAAATGSGQDQTAQDGNPPQDSTTTWVVLGALAVGLVFFARR